MFMLLTASPEKLNTGTASCSIHPAAMHRHASTPPQATHPAFAAKLAMLQSLLHHQGSEHGCARSLLHTYPSTCAYMDLHKGTQIQRPPCAHAQHKHIFPSPFKHPRVVTHTHHAHTHSRILPPTHTHTHTRTHTQTRTPTCTSASRSAISAKIFRGAGTMLNFSPPAACTCARVLTPFWSPSKRRPFTCRHGQARDENMNTLPLSLCAHSCTHSHECGAARELHPGLFAHTRHCATSCTA